MLLCEFILNSQPAPPGEPFLLRTLLELYLADALPEEAAGDADAGTRVPAASSKVRRCVGSATVLIRAAFDTAARSNFRRSIVLCDAANQLCRGPTLTRSSSVV